MVSKTIIAIVAIGNLSKEVKTGLLSHPTKYVIDKLLLERISLSGICRVCDVSEQWLLGYIKELYGNLPNDLNADAVLPDIASYLSDRMDEEIGRIEVIKKIQLPLRNT